MTLWCPRTIWEFIVVPRSPANCVKCVVQQHASGSVSQTPSLPEHPQQSACVIFRGKLNYKYNTAIMVYGGGRVPRYTILSDVTTVLVLVAATAAAGGQPLCDTDEHLATLWPDCGTATQFCVCTTHADWVCLPCPRGQVFAFEMQMCVPAGPPSEPEPATTIPTTTEVTERPDDGNDCSSDDWSTIAGSRCTTKFQLPMAAQRWKNGRPTNMDAI